VNENGLMVLFGREGIQAKQQVPITVYFEEEVVGNYYADIIIEDRIILEIKSVENIIDAHIAQTLNYLKATGLRLAIILNFSKEKLEYKRIVK
jgi:GxxExxY protein